MVTTFYLSDKEKIKHCCKDIWNLQRSTEDQNPFLHHYKFSSESHDRSSEDRFFALLPAFSSEQAVDLTNDDFLVKLAKHVCFSDILRDDTTHTGSSPSDFASDSLFVSDFILSQILKNRKS